jgi:hypothetical protein
MLRRLLSAVALIIAASLSASDATPGQQLTLSVGVEGCVGTLAVDPVAGLITSSATITSTAHVDRNLAVQVQPDAWPGVRHLIVRCDEATAEARLNVVDAGAVVYVPWATRSPAE